MGLDRESAEGLWFAGGFVGIAAGLISHHFIHDAFLNAGVGILSMIGFVFVVAFCASIGEL